MACSQPCTKTKAKVSKLKDKTTVPDDENDPDCEKDRDIKKALKKAIKAAAKKIKVELEQVVETLPCTSDKDEEECGCSGNWDKDWGDPLPGERKKEIVIGECKWTVTYEYEIEGKTYTGTCVPIKGISETAMGVIPVGPKDTEVALIEWPGELDAHTVKHLEGLLKDSARRKA